MRKWLLIAVFLVAGCATVPGPGNIDSRIQEMATQGNSLGTEIQTSYKQAFKAVISVFRDLNISILKKDFAGKQIVGIRPSTMEETFGSTYGVFFEETSQNLTKISVKVNGSYYKDSFILNKIKEEISLQKSLKE